MHKLFIGKEKYFPGFWFPKIGYSCFKPIFFIPGYRDGFSANIKRYNNILRKFYSRKRFADRTQTFETLKFVSTCGVVCKFNRGRNHKRLNHWYSVIKVGDNTDYII